MAADFISISTNTSTGKFANEAVQLSRQIRALHDLASGIRDKGQRMVDGADYTLFESLYGLPAGAGQPYLTFVTGMIDAMEGVAQNGNAVVIMNRVG